MKLQRPDPGIDAAKSGLHGKAGIFFNAGLFSKGGGFNPLDLDPYLLFDARTSMIGTLENPTLDLDPSKQDTLDVITATRAGVATYTDANGNIASASPNTVRVDQTQGAELTPTVYQNIGYTDFSQIWQTYNNGTSAINGGGYNGNPSKVIEALTAYGSYSYQVPTQDGVTYCLSFYIKRVSGSGLVRLIAYNSSGTTTVDITSSLTSEFTRVSFVFQGRSGGGNVRVGLSDYGSGDMEVEISQPQVEEGTTPSSFVANTTGSPKFITGATYGPRVPMILVEPSATNVIYNSSSFSTSGTAVKTTGFEAPDGSNTATKISNMQDATGTRSYSQVTAVSGSTAYVGSIYLKGTAGETIRIEARRQAGATFSSSGTQLLTFDGTWQRVTNLAWTTAADNTAAFILIKNESGTTADEVYLWGSQLEEGSVSTSVIPTSGSTVTRAADNLEISGSSFTDFFNSGGDGTFYAEFTQPQTEIVSYLLNGGSYQSRFFYSNNSSTLLNSFDGSNGPSRGTITINQLQRAAMSYNASTCSLSLNGGSESTTSTNGNFGLATKLVIGGGPSNNLHLNGRIKRLIYWPYHSDSL